MKTQLKSLFAIALASAVLFSCSPDDDKKTDKPEPPKPPKEDPLPELPGGPSGVAMRKVGYIPDYSYNCIKNNTLDWSALTHLNLAFVNPDSEGNMIDHFPAADLNMIVTKAHEKRVKVLAALGGGGGGNEYAGLIDTEEKMKAFCQKIMDYVTEHNLDGIDLDLELGQGSPLWTNYGAFVAELRSLLSAKNKLLTTAVSTWFSNDISTETLQSFDFVNIMAYDNEANGFENHSSYEFAETMAAHYAGRGVEKGKIVIGIPFYGYPRNGGWGDAKSFADILKQHPNAWQSDYAGTFSYNGHKTIALKCRLATVYGGVMIWQLDHDATGTNSLLGVIKKNL